MVRIAVSALALSLCSATQALAASSCALPRELPRPTPVVPATGEVQRVSTLAGYTLALSWSPQFCAAGRSYRAEFQCGGTNDFGFILHGLWPEGSAGRWPQYCRPASLVPREEVARTLCIMPSAQLMQHEWAKHGSCMASRPEEYFATARRLYQSLRLPDMARLARSPNLRVSGFILAISALNPGVKPDTVRVRTSRDGWLEEVWVCLDRRMSPTRCPLTKGGRSPGSPLRIRT